MSNPNEALRVSPDQTIKEAVECWQFDFLDQYLSRAEQFEPGTILLAPTYRLEEVEEVVEPEKPEGPVEPYVGLSWEYEGRQHVVVEVTPNYLRVAAQSRHWAWGVSQFFARGNWYTLLSDLLGYPHTPSTPAVTRKVKKWVKIEESPEC